MNVIVKTPKPKASGKQTIFWWVMWITLTIGSFFIAAAFWTPLIARHLGSIHQGRNALIWVTAVFGTWLLMLLPLIIVMYYKVDKAYEDARMRREKAALRFRSIEVDRSKRVLPLKLSQKLKTSPRIIEAGHLIHATLKDGRRVQNVFVQDAEEILGIYDASDLSFSGEDVVDFELVPADQLPPFSQSNWLRLDGAQLPE